MMTTDESNLRLSTVSEDGLNSSNRIMLPGLTNRGRLDSPYYSIVPKGFDDNLDFREHIAKLGARGGSNSHELWIMCRRDILFFINTFCYLLEPRTGAKLPFITYDFQDFALGMISSSVGRNDLLIKKSRDMGASWMCLTVYFWKWLFFDLQSFLLVSRKEEYVDKTGDPKSLFYKFMFLYDNLPRWLRPIGGIERNKMHVRNLSNGSTIDGESTTGDVAAGDRRTGILLDEFARVLEGQKVLASTRDATNSRIFLSTPQGSGTAFHEIEVSKATIPYLPLHWTIHPEKSKGLYYLDSKGLKMSAENIPWPERSINPSRAGIWKGNKLLSPWYLDELDRCIHPMEAAQELDMDDLGSDYQFFDSMKVDEHIEKYCQEPKYRGDLDYDRFSLQPHRFIEHRAGPLYMWLHIDITGKIPTDRQYVMGIDVSAGTGASNSCISIADARTKEKVAEYVTPGMTPEELAKVAIALARYFSPGISDPNYGAYMIWEANGPGRIFGNRIIAEGYRNIYCRKDEMSLSGRQSDSPGWFATKDTKAMLLAEYRRSIANGLYINRSKVAMSETKEYVYLTASNSIEHSRAAYTIDPSGAKDNHGDRVTADALCVKALSNTHEKAINIDIYPQNSYIARRKKWERDMKLEKSQKTELHSW